MDSRGVSVDASLCIRCAACSSLVPAVFSITGTGSAVAILRQPRDADEHRLAAVALLTCPSSAIGVARAAP